MSYRYQQIFFDLDGTLVDSFEGIEKGFQYVFQNTGINGISTSDIKKRIGSPLSETMDIFMKNQPDKSGVAVSLFRNYYNKYGMYESKLYNGVEILLNALSKQTNIFIITAKPSAVAKKMLEFHQIAHLFTDIKGCDADGKSFSKSVLLKNTDINTKSAIVGDKPTDIIAGKENGMDTIGVLYGFGTREEMATSKPDHIVSSVKELHDLLLN